MPAVPTITITDAGRAALVNADHDGTKAVKITTCGVTATAIVPDPAMTALPGEIKRIGTVSGGVVAADTIHLVVRDEAAESYTVRSLALYLADGTLFALYGQADPLLIKTERSMFLLETDITFPDVRAALIQFGDANFSNPPATTERQGVVELATDEETIAGRDATRAVYPRGLLAAFTAWMDARLGVGSPTAFTKTLLASASAMAARATLGLGNSAVLNIGHGNGVDADTLDGQHGSWFTDIIGRLGYTPIQQGGGAGQGASKVQIGWGGTRLKAQVDGADQGNIVFDKDIADVWRGSNDGSGSGMDSDLLDGQQGSWYADIKARLGYNPANKAGEAFEGSVETGGDFVLNRTTNPWGYIIRPNVPGYKYLSLATTGAGLLDQVNINTALCTRAGSVMWDAANDGAGSGLDADVFHGFTIEAFLRDLGTSFGTNGYIRFSNGLIVQWGTVAGTFPGNTDIAIVLPMAFPRAILTLVGANSDVVAQPNAVVGFNYSPPPGPGSFYFRTNVGGQNRINYLAVGW
jgi:hypothetical protein